MPLRIFFSCSLGGGGRYFSVPSFRPQVGNGVEMSSRASRPRAPKIRETLSESERCIDALKKRREGSQEATEGSQEEGEGSQKRGRFLKKVVLGSEKST